MPFVKLSIDNMTLNDAVIVRKLVVEKKKMVLIRIKVRIGRKTM